METPKEDSLVDQIRNIVAEIEKLTKTASKNRQSLAGTNFYGKKFDTLRSTLTQRVRELEAKVKIVGHPDLKTAMDSLKPHFELLVNPSTAKKERLSAKKELLYILDSQMESFVGGGEILKIPSTDFVIPMAIVSGTRGYIEKVVVQINGCYEYGWFDACAVMIRRLVETLIIECFEHHKISGKIKDNQGNFFHLKQLITICLQEKTWTLGRNARQSLPKLKDIGDLSAHNRRYSATKVDIDKISDGARIVVQELVHISGLK